MRFNLMFPMRAVKHYERWIGDGDLGEVARLAEEAGFDGVSVSDHPFPGNDWLADGGHHAFDPFVALGVMAARTRRVRLLTYVMVAAYRHPYVAANALASLDVLSGGRVIAGMAAGYLKPEFEVLGADFARRGATLDAAIPAMRAAWTGRDHPDGPFAAVGHTLAPKPAQAGGPQIWLGGNSAAARRRAVALGDGWMPIGQSAAMAAITGTPALESVADLAAQIAAMQRRRAEAGAAPLEVAFAPFEKDLLRSGTDAFCRAMAGRLAAYEEAGVGWLTIEPDSRSFEALRRDVAVLGESLIGRVRRG